MTHRLRSLDLRLLAALLIATLSLAACRTAPGHDPVVVRAEQVLASSHIAVDSFIRWEYTARPPERDVQDAADTLRREFPPAHRAAAALVRAYKVHRTPEHKLSLEGAIALLEEMAATATQYLARAAQ